MPRPPIGDVEGAKSPNTSSDGSALTARRSHWRGTRGTRPNRGPEPQGDPHAGCNLELSKPTIATPTTSSTSTPPVEVEDVLGTSPHLDPVRMNHTVDVEDTGSDSQSHLDDTRPVVVGRADELARLTELADRSVEEGARIVFVSGEAGIGKSTLIRRFTDDLADARWAVHTGHCIEYADRTIPFGPIVTIIRSLLASLADDVDDVIGHHRADVAALLPELESGGADSASLTGDVDRLIDAISTVLIRAAEHRPMVLFVEDIHWADAATRDLISSLVHSLGTSRILMIISERTGAVARGRAFHTWLAELRRFPNVETIALDSVGVGGAGSSDPRLRGRRRRAVRARGSHWRQRLLRPRTPPRKAIGNHRAPPFAGRLPAEPDPTTLR